MKTILVDAVDTFVSDNGEIFEDLKELLDSFENRKIILTGAPYTKFPVYNLDKMPYEVFTLEQNPPKTDSEYYERMLEHFGLSVDDVVYFEHNVDAVESARSVRIKTYHYDKEKRDLVGLREFLDGSL